MKVGSLLVIVITFLTAVLATIFFGSIKTNNDFSIPPVTNNSFEDNIHARDFLVDNESNIDLSQQFSSRSFLAKTSFPSAKLLRSVARSLDSLSNDEMVTRSILSAACTDTLLQMKEADFVVYQPDTILRLLQWIETYRNFDEEELAANNILFQSIHDYWMNFVSNKLSHYSSKNNDIKYDFKFQFAVAKCSEARFPPSVKVSSMEKFVENIISNRWTHLINATYNGTSRFQKAALVLIILITLISHVSAFRLIAKKFKPRSKQTH